MAGDSISWIIKYMKSTYTNSNCIQFLTCLSPPGSNATFDVGRIPSWFCQHWMIRSRLVIGSRRICGWKVLLKSNDIPDWKHPLLLKGNWVDTAFSYYLKIKIVVETHKYFSIIRLVKNGIFNVNVRTDLIFNWLSDACKAFNILII